MTSLNGTNDTESSEYYGPLLTGIFGTWLVLIIIFAVVGNVLVMLVILLDKEMRHAHNGTNLFLFTLAVSDVMTGIFIAPISLHTLIIKHWDLGDLICRANLFLNSLFLFTSVHCLMYISIHKYLSIKRLSVCDQLPVSKYACYGMISAAWIWGLLFSVLASTVLSHAEYKIKTTQCGPQYPLHDAQSIIISIGNFTLNFLIPFGIMLIMYLRIYCILKTSVAFRRKSTVHYKETKLHAGDATAINTLVIVLTCFFVCWLPYMFYTIYVFFTIDRRTLPAFLNPLVSNLSCLQRCIALVLFLTFVQALNKGRRLKGAI